MKVLVTGANGYIGRHVVHALLQQGHQVLAADVNLDGMSDEVQKITADVFDFRPGLFQRMGEPDVCIHLAWRDGFKHNSDAHMANLSSHYQFIRQMTDEGLKHISIMGTMHEVGYWEGEIDENTPCNPMSMYGIAKDALRRAVFSAYAQKDTVIQWLRAYYIFGDDGEKSNSIFGKLIRAANEGKKTFPFTSGKNKYDFISVQELGEMIARASTQDEVRGIINCCSGKPVSLGEQVEWFIKENGLDIRLEYGVFPDRQYDSPAVWGSAEKIRKIMAV